MLGLPSYYRQYIKDFSRIASPLYHLLKGPVEAEIPPTQFNSTSEQEDNNHHTYMEKWKQGMEQAYEMTRGNAHKAATRSKKTL